MTKKGELVLRKGDVGVVRGGWLSRWRGSGSGPVRAMLVSLQDAITRAAVGAARTSTRLASMSAQLRRSSQAVDETHETARRLNEDIKRIAASSNQTLDAAREMSKLSTDGRTLSAQGAASSEQLRAQMQQTVERIDRLVRSVQSITHVSKVIEDIARQTRLLSFNAAIEAARAGEQGRGFAVVAGEVRRLSDHTAQNTSEIKSLLRSVAEDLGPAREAVQTSQGLVETAAGHAHSVGEAMGRLAVLANDVSGHMQQVASAVDQQRQGVEEVFARLSATTEALQAISKDAEGITAATFNLSEITEETFQHFERVDTGTVFHRTLGLARELAQRSTRVFERAIDAGRCTLDDVLAFDYREIRGEGIRSLAHLFDVSRVPPEGFTPPKYHTRYDEVVDLALKEAMDGIKAREPALIFALLIDLNSYGPIHNTEYCRDWTGDPAKDLVGNRVKRFFTDQRVLVRGARVGLGARAAQLPDRASRGDFERAGCPLAQAPGSADAFLVQTYARDTGAIVTVLTAPVFVKGQRWGAVLLGWNTDGAR
ncbi:MAG TPA: methyl-accepting chemotaxis protein [Burkholderiales bacterium]|nr:methyl-accepting chemotaxis protein [Burkholderiales bacterium]